MEAIIRKMGVLPDRVDVRDYKINTAMVRSKVYPESFSLNCGTKIKDQGSVGSCAAFAASEILEYHQENKVTLSTNFIYGIHYKLFGSRGPGMFLREVCKIIKDYGDPQEEYCRGNTEVDAVYEIAEKAFNNEYIMENAAKHRISKYARVSTDDDIKYALMNYGPVLTSIAWYSKNTCDRTTGILTKSGNFDGYHAIVIYGWDKDGWLCQNSWGRYWGKLGTFKISFDYGINTAFSLIKAEADDGTIDIPVQKDIIRILYKVFNFFMNIGADLFRKLTGRDKK